MKSLWPRPTHRLIATMTALGTLTATFSPVQAASTARPTHAVPTGYAAPPRHGGGGIPATGTPRTVTLVTGDQVTVFPSGGYTVTRGPGRTEVSFFTDYTAGHLSVVPGDAAKLLRAGRLDERLFNITDLIEQGYDDRRSELPLIVMTEASGEAFVKARAKLAPDVTAQVQELSELHTIAVHERRVVATRFWRTLTSGDNTGDRVLAPGISQVWLDGIRQLYLDESVPQIGAPVMWRAGFTGKGVTVAVLDTGLDPGHPDLAGRVVASRAFHRRLSETDYVGHGTHVASIIAGSGTASDGRYRGVAPEARLAAGKVCIERACLESAILAGMGWAVIDQHASVVNLSLGGRDRPGLDPLEQAVETLTARYGTLFVIAAGNDGEDGVDSPASAPSALAVGATDKADALADFSSRGPAVDEAGLKPDLTAPGVNIVAARSGYSDLPGGLYTKMSGTSMATPHVAGAAALLAQQHPDWMAPDLKAALMGSAIPDPELGVYAQGAGRIDLTTATKTTVTAQPASISFGRPHYPHDNNQQIHRWVSYHNNGSEEVTLSLTVSATLQATANSAQVPAPERMFRVEPETITVYPGDDTQVLVSADPSVDSPNGYAGGYLTATSYGLVVRTPFALHKEVESYDLNVTHLDRTGAPAEFATSKLASLDGTKKFTAHRAEGDVATVRVPRGTYVLTSNIDDRSRPGDSIVSLLVQPRLEVTADQSLVVDARTAAPVTAEVSVPEGKPNYEVLATGWLQDTPAGQVGAGILTFRNSQLFAGRVGPKTGAAAGFASQVNGVWIEETHRELPERPQFSVNLSWYVNGSMITGFRREVTSADLAVVHARRASTAAESRSFSGAMSHQPGRSALAQLGTHALLPGTRTDYYNTAGGVEWIPFFAETPSNGLGNSTYLEGPSMRFEAGHSYQLSQNFGVFGPTLARADQSEVGVWREDNTVRVRIPLFGDGAGNQGRSTVSAAETVLTANGERLDDFAEAGSGDFVVPPGPQRYQLTTSARRDPGFELSTQVTGTWSFRSAQTTSATALPLWTIGFAPQLDDTNTVVAGKELTVPLRFESQPGADVGTLGTIIVDVSFDDGVTWSELPVRSAGGLSTVALSVPSGSGFASLRASAADSNGNTVEETIIHAYRYGRER